tara:strand:+ start:797 stop:1012 length:216 start_codon:yes stop_codon:yes gene_type:complete
MRTFFGLTYDYIEDVYEQMFFMNYTGNWSITELYNLPIGLRRWFVEKTIKQKESEQEAREKAQNKSRRSSR